MKLSKTRFLFSLSTLLSITSVVLTSCSADSESQSHTPGEESTLRVLLQSDGSGAWPSGLDPATNSTGGANITIMNAIFGGLFQLSATADGKSASLTPVLAERFELLDDGRTVLIVLRNGLRFSDGSPLDAEAVRFNIERNLAAPCTCAPTRWPWATEKRVSVLNQTTLALHFSRPYPAALSALPVSNLNWIASPTSLEKMGEQAFRIAPVGAGPFKVVSNTLSSKLVLEKNPLYWQVNRPLLSQLTFESVGGEQSAYLALLAGDADVAEGITSVPLITQVISDGRVRVTEQPSTSVYWVQLNTRAGPFSNKALREAIYYATDVDAIRRGLTGGRYLASQSFTASGGMYYEPKVENYRGYDLEKARKIVQKLGPTQVTFSVVRDILPEQIATALQSQWEQAGIMVKIEQNDLAVIQERYKTGNWHVSLQRAGSFDPDAGLMRRLKSDQTYSGISDPEIDRLLAEGGSTANHDARRRSYKNLARRISDEAYGPFLFEVAMAQFSQREVFGPGLSSPIPPILTSSAIHWHEVGRSEPSE